MREIWVAGAPSFCGGADVELDHNIDLWRSHEVNVNLVPMYGLDPQIKELCDKRGCHTHLYKPDIFKDKIVACWCNGNFLDELPKIMSSGKPAMVIWFNCMTYLFDNEITAHRNKWINLFGFVSDFQKGILKPQLEKFEPVNELLGYKPYFNLNNPSQKLTFEYRKPDKWFALGRVSRDDGNKYSQDMWRIFHKVCSPLPTKTFILGYGENANKKTGSAPQGLDWQTWLPGGIPVKEFYEKLHVIIHKTGGSRESFCRIVPEAYAAGIPIIVEDDFAFPKLVIDGVTGFRCKSSDEMSFRASELAFNEEKRKAMVFAGHEFLLKELANNEGCWGAWNRI